MEPTLIDGQANIEGTLKGKDAQILGSFKGEVAMTGHLILGESSHVDATISADAAEVGGEFRGEIKARSVTLTEKARVEGRLQAQVLVVREGARLNADVAAGRDGASGAAAG
jgi:cytoskeletal protein CcmA (bactofilin family)